MNDTEHLPPRYTAENHEREIYKLWEEWGVFAPQASRTGKTFSIALPPPNVTGTLHIGHAFEHSLQDALVRYHRLRGDRTLWAPGTDHAAIATTARYEKDLYKKEKKTRHDFSREEFFERVQAFALENQSQILGQMKRLGDSVDWSRLAFTLDEERERAVRTAFKRMYDDGLIYRGNRVVNWDPKGQTTLSDDEIVYEEVSTTFYIFRYAKEFPIPIATTRPETKLGDVAVAVHPDDARYKEYVGQTHKVRFVGLPLEIKIIADQAVDPEFGTGAVGVTPAHSMIDWEMAERHHLSLKAVINESAKIENVSPEFNGRKIIEARELIVAKLRAEGLIEKETSILHSLAKSERTGGVIEPLPKLQWFVDVDKPFHLANSKLQGLKSGSEATLQEIMQTVVQSGEIEIVPEHFRKIYAHWVDNLRDWCVSRQILYGHRIPVWYRGDELYVGVEVPDGEGWEQDPDTLDTWFSSALWTFSTLGWPATAEDIKTFHPTSVINPGYEILTLWVSRMIMMSGYLLGEIPFRTVLIHGVVRAKDGRKFSKSLDNGIDPLEVIDEYGTDALRMSLIVGVAPGSDVKFDLEKVKAYKHFANKVWNIARFVLMSSDGGQLAVNSSRQKNAIRPKTEADRVILAALNQAVDQITQDMETFQLHLAAERIYHFIWHEFADVYLEASKAQLDDESTRNSTAQILYAVLATSLKLLHPFMPFITETIWQRLPAHQRDSDLLAIASWPEIYEPR
ncbi:valine--tRNA ligase [Candidatus Berkelbacteria bacterium]|nr:valine--tRNA ligase [Candidatus Berkelbacteria bacterium]